MKESTKIKILNTAEALFADQGFARTSIRQIVQEAGVNIAAINYHFGNKETLYIEVLRNVFEDIQKERLELLDEARSEGKLTLEAVISAFASPVFNLPNEGAQHLTRLIMRRMMDATAGDRKDVYQSVFKPTRDAFLKALAECLPDDDENELYWHFHFMISALVSMVCQCDLLDLVSENKIKTKNLDGFCEHYISYVCAAINARKVKV